MISWAFTQIYSWLIGKIKMTINWKHVHFLSIYLSQHSSFECYKDHTGCWGMKKLWKVIVPLCPRWKGQGGSNNCSIMTLGIGAFCLLHTRSPKCVHILVWDCSMLKAKLCQQTVHFFFLISHILCKKMVSHEIWVTVLWWWHFN
jgi:hypothetical protein